MRNELYVDMLVKPVCNKILVEVTDTFNEFRSKGGIDVVNAAHEEAWADSQVAVISEFVPRFGRVVSMPKKITRGSFDYETTNELLVNDIVYWNLISFKEHIPLVYQKRKYLLVDYHEVIFRIRAGVMAPVNGFVLLTPVAEETKILEYRSRQNVTEKWKIFRLPENHNKELNPDNEFTPQWEEGDIVHIMVFDKPFKVEGQINSALDKQYYAVYERMIMCTE